MGVTLDGWQEQVLQAAMGERSDGKWAARMVGVSAPRQQGKSQLIVARALAGVMLFGEKTIICSAHQTDTAREVFQRLLDIIDANPAVARRVDSVMRALNREYIRFAGGAVIKIKARSISGGRGFSSDCLLLDEAQILGAAAWSSILPTMSAQDNPQAWLLGTPPTQLDDGDVFARLRQRGIEGKDSRLAYLEWSAGPTDDMDDPATWARANPAYPYRISHEAIEAERAAMDDAQFGLERLGRWSPGASHRVIPAQSWTDAGDETSVAVDRLALGVEVGPDKEWASLVLAGQRSDRDWHIELDDRRDGTAWVVPAVAALLKLNPKIRAVVADAGSPTAALLPEFKAAKIRVTEPRVKELGVGCTQLLQGVVTGSVHHTRQPQMNSAVGIAGKRRLGDTGMWVFSRASAHSDITPIQAAVLALIGAQATKVTSPARSERKVVVYT